MDKNSRSTRPIVIWLCVLCVLVFGTVLVGGITRLTESGLSITDWKPFTGAFPPTSDAAWQRAFDDYKAFPQYQKVNQGMTLGDFKFIFWWEFIHRNLGRLIGVAFFFPFVYFLWRRLVSGVLARRLAFAFVLGGLQGALGWYMVQSGLVDMPRVSHYRLTAHLSLALFILTYLFWLILDLKVGRQRGTVPKGVRVGVKVLTAVISLQIVLGAFTAGMRAGIGYNTFPLMNGFFAPPGLMYLDPKILNFFENPVMVQFLHRNMAYLVVLGVAALWWRTRSLALDSRQRLAVRCLVGTVAVQFLLGVLTLVLVVPVSVASMHQVGACFLLLSAVFALHSFSPARAPAPVNAG